MAPYYTAEERKQQEDVREWTEEIRPRLMTWVEAVRQIANSDNIDESLALADLRKALADGIPHSVDYEIIGVYKRVIMGGEGLWLEFDENKKSWLSKDIEFDFKREIVINKSLSTHDGECWESLLLYRADIDKYWPARGDLVHDPKDSSATELSVHSTSKSSWKSAFKQWWDEYRASHNGLWPQRSECERWRRPKGVCRNDVREFRTTLIPEKYKKGGRPPEKCDQKPGR